MGIDINAKLCFGAILGSGEDVQEIFEDFLDRKGNFSPEDSFYDIFESVDAELNKMAPSPFCLEYAAPYFDCRGLDVTVYVTHKDFKNNSLSLEEVLKILQDFDKEVFNGFLRDIGVEEEQEPRIFCLPDVS